MVHLNNGPDVVVCYVHPLDAAQGGWRWAVHAGQRGPANLDGCINAGWAPSAGIAASEGEPHAATAVQALRLAGIGASYAGVVTLDGDPTAGWAARGLDTIRIV